jgi:hypothetical protein
MLNLLYRGGYGNTDVYEPGEDVERLSNFLQAVCLKKAMKDYSDCTLVIVIDFLPIHKKFRALYTKKIQQLLDQVQSISFKAKRVFLLLLEQHKIYKVYDRSPNDARAYFLPL